MGGGYLEPEGVIGSSNTLQNQAQLQLLASPLLTCQKEH